MIVLRLINNGTELLAGTYRGIFKSIDYGFSWLQVLSVSGVEVVNDIIEVDTNLYAGSVNYMSSSSGGFYSSSDNGNNWELSSLIGYGISDLEFNDNLGIIASVHATFPFGIFISQDEGINWSSIYTYQEVQSIVVDDNGFIYAGLESDMGGHWGVIRSVDQGLSWEDISSGMSYSTYVRQLAININDFLLAITVYPNKLYRSINPIVSMVEEELSETCNNKGAGYITSIFPNPTNDLLTINYSVKTPGKAVFMVASLTGQKLISYQKDIDSAGEYIWSLDFYDLSEGIYFLSFYLNDRLLETKKMMRMD